MKPVILSLLSICIVSACAEPSFYDRYVAGNPLQDFPYKPGATGTDFGNDNTDCRIEAAQRVPQQIASRTSPTYQMPTQTTCNRYGTQTFCSTTGGEVYGGQTTLYDANAGLRNSAARQCMERKGYRYLTIPACPVGSQLAPLPNGPDSGLPPLSATTCYLVEPNGQWAVGNRMR